MKLTIRKVALFSLMLLPIAAWGAVTSANDRRAVSGDYVAPNATGVSTQFERMDVSGDFLVGGEPSSGGGGTPLHTLPVTGGG